MMGKAIGDNDKITISLDRTMVISFILGAIFGYILHRWVSERLYYNVPEFWSPNPWAPNPSYGRIAPYGFRGRGEEEETEERPWKRGSIFVGEDVGNKKVDEFAEYEL
jgi:hypothetical protein